MHIWWSAFPGTYSPAKLGRESDVFGPKNVGMQAGPRSQQEKHTHKHTHTHTFTSYTSSIYIYISLSLSSLSACVVLPICFLNMLVSAQRMVSWTVSSCYLPAWATLLDVVLRGVFPLVRCVFHLQELVKLLHLALLFDEVLAKGHGQGRTHTPPKDNCLKRSLTSGKFFRPVANTEFLWNNDKTVPTNELYALWPSFLRAKISFSLKQVGAKCMASLS